MRMKKSWSIYIAVIECPSAWPAAQAAGLLRLRAMGQVRIVQQARSMGQARTLGQARTMGLVRTLGQARTMGLARTMQGMRSW